MKRSYGNTTNCSPQKIGGEVGEGKGCAFGRYGEQQKSPTRKKKRACKRRNVEYTPQNALLTSERQQKVKRMVESRT